MGLIVDEHTARRGAPRRRPHRLPQRHDVAAGARRRRGRPHERRPGLADPHRRSAASCSRCCSTASTRRTRRSGPTAKSYKSNVAKDSKLLSVPAEKAELGRSAGRYANDELGDIEVTRADGVTTFDFGEWQSEVGSRTNPDGTTSFMTIAPGISGLEFVVGSGEREDADHARLAARVRLRRHLIALSGVSRAWRAPTGHSD